MPVLVSSAVAIRSSGQSSPSELASDFSKIRAFSKVRAAALLEEGFAAVLSRKKRATPPVQPIFDGEAQARLIALACSTPPDGHGRWSIRLLAEKVVELEIVESVHFNTVGRALKKTISSHI